MYAKHTVYYDALPHYFLEFDILDRETGTFLDTRRRREMLAGAPVASVPVLAEGSFQRQEDLLRYLGPSRYITPQHLEHLRESARKLQLDEARAIHETDLSLDMEGLYLKVEEDGIVSQRLKFVRAAFYQAVERSDSHWQERPILPNRLAIPAESLFLPELPRGN